MNLDIDLLRTFAAVADSGSFTAAAGVVSRTQSAVSMQVKRLEEAVGKRVFERSSRSLALTRDGDVLLGYARRMLDLHDESLRRLRDPPVTGQVRLGATEYFVPNQLPVILARFAQRHPGVRLDVTMGLSADLRRAMREGKLDAAIVRTTPDAAEARQALWHEPQHWVAAEGFDVPDPVPLVALPPGCVLRDFAIEAFRRGRRAWRLAYSGNSMASVQAAILAGLGVSILSQSAIVPGMRILSGRRAWPDPGALAAVLLQSRAAPQAVVDAFADVIREALGAAKIGPRQRT